MSQQFWLPTEIITGRGSLAQVGRVAARFGQRAMIVCGARSAKSSGVLSRVMQLLEESRMQAVVFADIVGEADLTTVERGIGLARQAGTQVFIGLGGGSAIDTAKAIAGLAQLPGTVWEYHTGRHIDGPSLPLVAVPTTAGTGAEVTKNAVLIDPRRQIKESIRDDNWFPRVALVDPETTASMPPHVTASTGSDALCQAIEAFTSIAATPVTDALARQAIALIGSNLERAFVHGSDLEAREAMSLGSLMAGMAMSNARLGGVHGMAHPLGAHHQIPHGITCGLLLPYTMAYNLPYAQDKYAEVARLFGEDVSSLPDEDAARYAVETVRSLVERIGVPLHLSEFGVNEERLPRIIRESLPSGSLKHNPRPLGAEDVRLILMSAL